jgi:hypothetical protein
MRKLSFVIAAAVMVFGFLLQGANAEGLSRDKAKKMIIDASKLPRIVSESFSHLPLGSSFSESALYELEKQGLLKVGQIDSHWKKEITITDEGNKYLLKKEGTSYIVKAYEIHFGEITGVITEGKHANVEYTTIYKNVTPFGKVSGVKEGKIINSSAHFSLYDDGWRIR